MLKVLLLVSRLLLMLAPLLLLLPAPLLLQPAPDACAHVTAVLAPCYYCNILFLLLLPLLAPLLLLLLTPLSADADAPRCCCCLIHVSLAFPPSALFNVALKTSIIICNCVGLESV